MGAQKRAESEFSSQGDDASSGRTKRQKNSSTPTTSGTSSAASGEVSCEKTPVATTLVHLERGASSSTSKQDVSQENSDPGAASSSKWWLPEGHRCSTCNKMVLAQGGAFCCRRRPDSTVGGCGVALCWTCMNRAPRETFGTIKTNKNEFASLGRGAWWMHEACMNATDMREYYETTVEEKEAI